jgi:acetyl esterase/lipase
VASAIGLLNTANALRPFSRSGYVTVPNFATGLPTSELPLVALGVSVARLTYALARGRVRGRAGAVSTVLTAASWAGLAELHRRGTVADRECERALVDALGPGYRDGMKVPKPPGEIPKRPPGTLSMVAVRRRYVHEDATIPYGPHGAANLLDVWRHRDLPRGARAPVLVQIPGGAWVSGNKENQAYPLLSHLAARGWVCVSISYRVAPTNPWPAQIHDVKRALAWVKENIADFGGDPGFVAVTGGSAGGHLASLAALTPDDPALQPGFEYADTSVVAAVPLYGRYDWVAREGRGRGQFMTFLEHAVVRERYADRPEVFSAASPLYRVHPDAPPFFVLHGTADSLIPVEEGREFVDALRKVTRSTVGYVELAGAQHAFEVFGSPRARHTATAVESFLNSVWTRRTAPTASPRAPRPPHATPRTPR